MAITKEIKLMKAVETMRHLSEHNIPFDIEFISYNESTGKSDGLKKETKILLMPGYRRNQSSKHDILVSYLRISFFLIFNQTTTEDFIPSSLYLISFFLIFNQTTTRLRNETKS